MKWKLMTGAVLIVLVGGVSVALHAKDKISEDRARRLGPFADAESPFGESLDFEREPTPQSESVKARFLRLASEYAKNGDEAELQRMADDLQKKINERDAEHKVLEIQTLLQSVLEKYPQTAAGIRAKSMLDASLPAAHDHPEGHVHPDKKESSKENVVPELPSIPNNDPATIK